MGGFHGTRIRILLALAVVLPALLALLALQFARDDAREASRTLSTLIPCHFGAPPAPSNPAL